MSDKNPFLGNDDIYEAIKREDFLKKVKRFFPLVLSASVLIVVVAIVYSWMSYRYQDRLYKEEKEYKKLLSSMKEKDFVRAKSEAKVLSEQKGGFSFLALFQKASIIQNSIQITGSSLDWSQLESVYSIIAQKSESIGMKSFLVSAQQLLLFQKPSQEEKKQLIDKVRSFSASGHSWYSMGLMLSALWSCKNDPQNFQVRFQEWEADTPSLFQWLPIYASIGARITRKIKP